MQNFSLSPREILRSLVKNKSLILNLIEREVIARYKGSVLGLLWSFFNPIFMLGVYTFVFSSVFKMSWSAGSDSKTEFALILFAGLIVFNFFAECCNKAPMLIINNVNYVKKVIFPLETLSWVNIGSSLFHTLVSLTVWIFGYILINGWPHATVLLLPLVFLPLILFTVGISWMLAALGVYFRDIAQITALATNVLMFLSPIFYSIEALPEKYRFLIALNPLAQVISWTRDILYWGIVPNFSAYLTFLLISTLCAWIGFIWFQKTRKGFADVI